MTAKGTESIIIQEPGRQEEQLMNIMEGPMLNSTIQVLGAKGDFYQMAERLNRHPTAHGRKVVYDERGGKTFKMAFTRGKDRYTLTADMESLSGYNSSVRKILVYIFEQVNATTGKDIELADRISFPLHEFVKVGIYKDIRSARRGYKSATGPLMSLRVAGKWYRGKTEIGQDIVSIFPRMNIYKGNCTVYINPALDMKNFFAPFFTILPKFYFSLPAKAADLLYIVFVHARMNLDKIKNKGYFDIGFRSIAQFLGLPDETETKNATSAIKKPIEDAITAIEEKIQELGQSGNLTLTPYSEAGASIVNYLDRGFLRVGMAGEYVLELLKTEERNTKKMIAAIRKKEKREEEAKTRRLVKKLEKDEAAKKKEDK